MEKEQFDVLTRQWGAGAWSRRRLARVLGAGLVGSAVGSAAAAFGLIGVAAKRKHRKKQRHKKAEPLQPQPQQSCGVDERQCPDGTRVSQGSCCADQRACGDGSCISAKECCPDADPPTCGDCQAAVCEDGALVCRSTCEEGVVCCNGRCAGRCTGGAINPATCLCECPSGTELLADAMTCCPIERACGRKGNTPHVPTVCCPAPGHCCDDFDICVDEGSACE